MTLTRPSAQKVTAPEPNRSLSTIVSSILLRQESTLVLVLLVIAVLTGLRNSGFWASANLLQVLVNTVIFFVMACGSALLIIGGGLDFSVGAVFTFGALVATLLLTHHWPWPIAVLVGLAAGAVVGFVNFLIVAIGHVPPIIATLGTFFMLLGVNNIITSGNDVLPLPAGFQHLGQGKWLGLSYVVWYAIVIGVCFWFLLERTSFGVNIRALGGNRQAAIGNALKVRRLDLLLYCTAALTSALAGIIYSAQVGAGQVTAGGASTTLTVLTAVLIGGVSLLGGLGTVTGVAFGALLLSLISNALVVAKIPTQYNNIVVGVILVVAVSLDHLRRQRIYRKR